MEPLSMGLAALAVVAGIALLVAGGELLVRGASSVAARLGIPPAIVGLTIVSIATGMPELAVSVDAMITGRFDVALGNVAGSNIANALVVVGVGALVAPVVAQRAVINQDGPIMVGLTGVLVFTVSDGTLSVFDAAILVAALIAYMALCVIRARRQHDLAPPSPNALPMPRAVLAIVGGVALLAGGARALVWGASDIATALGVSELIVGLTIVALGTSLPEIVTTVSAMRQGQTDLAIGNAIGSNIVNIGLVLGAPVLIGGAVDVPAAVSAFDLPVALASGLCLWAVAMTSARITRGEGVTLVALYVAYLAYLVLAAADHDALSGYTTIMAYFVLPMVVVAFGIGIVKTVLHRRSARA